MTDPRTEPSILRIARAAAQVLPKGRSAMVRSIARLTGQTAPFVASVGEDRFLIDLSERVSRTIYLFGVFEPTIATLLRRLAAPGAIVADVGANFGYFTVLLARAVGPGGKVLAFEPDPRNIARLKTNIRANNLSNVEHVPMGVFDRSGHVTFNLAADGEDNLGSSSIISEGVGRNQVQIPIVTLDEFAASRNIERIDLMKMDIEGAELQGLAGAQRMIAEKRLGQILVEIHNEILGADKAREIVDRLAATGYRGWLVREDAATPQKLSDFLQPLGTSPWHSMANPHVLFTSDPIV